MAPPLESPDLLNGYKSRLAAEEDRIRLNVDDAIKKAQSDMRKDPDKARDDLQRTLSTVKSYSDLSERTQQELVERLTNEIKYIVKETPFIRQKQQAAASASGTQARPGSSSSAATTSPYGQPANQLQAAEGLKKRKSELSLHMETIIDFGGIDKGTTLKEALDELQKKFDVTFLVNERQFDSPLQAYVLQKRQTNPQFQLNAALDNSILEVYVAGKVNPIPPMKKVTLGTVLNKILSRLPIDATWAVRPDTIEITTPMAMMREVQAKTASTRPPVSPMPGPVMPMAPRSPYPLMPGGPLPGSPGGIGNMGQYSPYPSRPPTGAPGYTLPGGGMGSARPYGRCAGRWLGRRRAGRWLGRRCAGRWLGRWCARRPVWAVVCRALALVVACRAPAWAAVCRALALVVACRAPAWAAVCRAPVWAVVCQALAWAVVCQVLAWAVVCQGLAWAAAWAVCQALGFGGAIPGN